MPRNVAIQVRRGTATQWVSSNPILYAGEICLETDTKRTKYGDGSTHWNDLAYATYPIFIGTATILAEETSIDVIHNLMDVPTNIVVTPKGNIGYCWTDAYTSTQFTIHCSVAPTSNTDVNWIVIV